MTFLETTALAAFLLISVLFFVIGSLTILFHLLCAGLLAGFLLWTGKNLDANCLGEWVVFTIGLTLYWFGLTIVRIMLTRSVSLNMLGNFGKADPSVIATEGIATRLGDAENFSLVSISKEACRLTFFGRAIAFIVASAYWILRIK